MRLPNGYGSVTKLSGKRRKPYIARVTSGMEFNEAKQDYVQKRITLGYFAKKSEALEALAKYSKNPYSALDASMTLRELWDQIKDNVNASDDRKKVYCATFDKYMSGLADMPVRDIKTKHLQQAIDDCGHGYSTKSNIRSVMRHLYRYACQNDLVDKNYVDFIQFEQEKTILDREIYTDEEVCRLWDHADQEEYALTLIFLHEGMRLKEFRDLSKEDVDLDNKTINIKQAKNRYSERIVPIHDKVYPLIKKMYEAPGDHLTEIDKSRYERFCKHMLGHRAYDVRHTFATKCHTLGIKELVIQRIMGHKPDTLLADVYTHLSIEELSEAMNKVSYKSD